MKSLLLKVTLHSQTLIGSGEGFGAIIDSDIILDEVGMPLIPARRIKGCLRDAAFTVLKMFEQALIDFPHGIDYKDTPEQSDKLHEAHQELLDKTFGKRGMEFDQDGQPFCKTQFSTLTLPDYPENYAWLTYASQQYPGILSQEAITETFTTIRQQTAINEHGVADEHSLRTLRAINQGHVFSGPLEIKSEDPNIQTLLALACLQFRHLGTNRNRGFGEVECQLFDQEAEVSVSAQLEALCND